MSLDYDLEIHDPVIVYSLMGKITSDNDYLDFEKEVFNYYIKEDR